MFDCVATADDDSKSFDVGDNVGLRVAVTGNNMEDNDIGLAMNDTVADVIESPPALRSSLALG